IGAGNVSQPVQTTLLGHGGNADGSRQWRLELADVPGGLTITWCRRSGPPQSLDPYKVWLNFSGAPEIGGTHVLRCLGFGWTNNAMSFPMGTANYTFAYTSVRVPYGLSITLLLIGPSVLLLRRRRKIAPAVGVCWRWYLFGGR